MISSCPYLIRRDLIHQNHRFIYRIKNAGLINQAPANKSQQKAEVYSPLILRPLSFQDIKIPGAFIFFNESEINNFILPVE
jgi:hypothetical protein